MKILLVNIVCGRLSTGRICTDLAEELEKEGHIVKIAYGRGHVPEQYSKYAVKIGNRRDIYLHVVQSRLFDRAGFASISPTKRFIQWIEEFDPDIIHLHNIHGYYINVKLLFDYLKKTNRKVIWTLHDCWAITGHCSHFENNTTRCDRWKDGCYKCPQKNEYPLSYTDFSRRNWLRKREAFCGVKDLVIVTPSEWLRKTIEDSYLREYPIIVINNGIDVNRFKYRGNDFRTIYKIEDKFLILAVASSWNDNKGYHDLISLASIISNDSVLVIVGVNNAQLQALPNNIIGIKKTDSIEELIDIYSAADLFVNFTYADTYPTVNLEALACGCPVLTYNTGGSAEIVEKNGGYIIERGNYKSALTCIESEKKKKSIMRFTPETNSISHSAQAYLRLYENMQI